MLLSPKSRLGTYEILGPLGAGGMGEVYRARDLRLGREVAIKVLPAEVASSPDRLARFEREARTVAGLNHPNIVVLYSVEDEDGVRFLTMELVEGQTLSTFLSPGGLPLSKLLELAIPLTDALVAAHEKGVIHRDLKPGNVMVTREGRLKVLDFGLAKMMGADPPIAQGTSSSTITVEPLITGTGHILGTVPYMAPEQLRGESVDARADLFSLGIVLYELGAGHRPFTGEGDAEVISAILRDTPEPLNQVRPDLPPDLGRIVNWCLEKNPRERIQSALDVNHELRHLQKAVEHAATEKPPTDKVVSIAVLPFVNRSASADDEYFSDGLADELLNVLSKIRGLRVTARASAFQFRGTKDDIATIGRKLNVVTLLDGSVRKAGNRIRVSVQLINVTDSSHLWSETYDRMLEDIFAVQDDIAQSVVRELRATLLGKAAGPDEGALAEAHVTRATKGRTIDPEAYRLYLLARHLLDRGAREETAKAIRYLQDALARDPGFALAWAELGKAFGMEAGYGWAPIAEGYGRAREAVERALSLEPDLPEGHLRLGRIRMYYDWDWRGAEASYARALELAPEDPRVLLGSISGLLFRRRIEEAIARCRRMLHFDPLGPGSHAVLGGLLTLQGQFAEAEQEYRRELELHPARGLVHGSLAEVLGAQGRGQEALAEALCEPEEWVRLHHLAHIHLAMRNEDAADTLLHELTEKYAETAAFQIAEISASLGRADAAFEWLERAYRQRDGGLVGLQVSQYLRRLHEDPRWCAFVKKMGMAD